jgi:hypothetical protein
MFPMRLRMLLQEASVNGEPENNYYDDDQC